MHAVIVPSISKADIHACAAIWLEASRAGHDFIPASVWEENLEKMTSEYLPASRLFLAVVEGKPAAFAAVRGNCLAALFCLPEYWGKKTGSALLRHLFTLYEQLSLSVYQKNGKAISLYERHGFTKISEQICPHTGEKELCMIWKRPHTRNIGVAVAMALLLRE